MLVTLLKMLFNQSATNHKAAYNRQSPQITRKQNIRFLQEYLPGIYITYKKVEAEIKHPKNEEWLQATIKTGINRIEDNIKGWDIVNRAENYTFEKLQNGLKKHFEYKEYHRRVNARITENMTRQEKFYEVYQIFAEVEREYYRILYKNVEQSRFLFIKDDYPYLFKPCRALELATSKDDIYLFGYLSALAMERLTGIYPKDYEPGEPGFHHWLSEMETLPYYVKTGEETRDEYLDKLCLCIRAGFIPEMNRKR